MYILTVSVTLIYSSHIVIAPLLLLKFTYILAEIELLLSKKKRTFELLEHNVPTKWTIHIRNEITIP